MKALKEWAIACRALERGEQVILLRKGGIGEKRFAVEDAQFYLYPSYEHQRPELIKGQYLAELERVLAEADRPGQLTIRHWARVEERHEVSEEAEVEALSPHYIFSTSYAQERLHWRPRQPLQVLFVRVFRLSQPIVLPVLPAYGGCSSWVDLEAALPEAEGAPVLAEAEFRVRVDAVKGALGTLTLTLSHEGRGYHRAAGEAVG